MLDLDKAISRLIQSLKTVRRKKGKIGSMFLLGIFALMLISSMSVSVSTNEVQPSVIPFTLDKSFALSASGSEWISVNSYSATYQEWNARIGSSPYLDAQDHPTNYISENKDELMDEGWFGFPDTTGTGTLTVNVSIWGFSDDSDDGVIVFVDETGSGGGSNAGTLIMDLNTGSYKTLALGEYTVSEINLMRIFLRTTDSVMDDIEIDHMRLGVSWASAGTDYEEFYYETVTAADVLTTAVAYDRAYTESVSAVDVIAKVANFARYLVESIGVVGVISIAKLTTKDMIETISASDVKTTAVNYTRNRIESISASDIIARGIGLNMLESIGVVDVITASKFITQNMFETITASDVKTTAVDYVRNRIEAISAIDAQSNAAAYVRDYVEAITASDIIDAGIVGGIDYEKNLIEGITVIVVLVSPDDTIINGSMFYQLFFSLNMWGYIGPVALVIGGYFITNKEKALGIFFIIVDSLIIATYLSLIEATPAYWWHVIIILLGELLIVGKMISDR